jgi:hypothetical protein
MIHLEADVFLPKPQPQATAREGGSPEIVIVRGGAEAELTDEELETIASGWDQLTLLTIAGIPYKIHPV